MITLPILLLFIVFSQPHAGSSMYEMNKINKIFLSKMLNLLILTFFVSLCLGRLKSSLTKTFKNLNKTQLRQCSDRFYSNLKEIW